jgi:uncharacterized protein YbjT (DUF2867 family)
LRDAGYSVRVLSRNGNRARLKFPEPFEVVKGDAMKRADVQQALRGCDAVHISLEHEHEDQCVTQVVEAGKAQGLERITYVSGTTVCEENRWFPLVDHKLKSEEAIRASGIGYMIFCPTWFMELLPRFVRGGRVILFGKPWRRWHFIAVQDFGRLVAKSYRCREALNKRFYMHGPQAFTLPEALQHYCRVLHPQIKSFRHMPYWLLRLIAWLRGNAELRFALNLVAYLEKVGERGDPTEAYTILGAPQVTLDKWLQRQKAILPGTTFAGDGHSARGG